MSAPVETAVDRETWLRQAVDMLRPWFLWCGYPVPERIRVSVGFGPNGGRQENKIILGVCLSRACAEDNVNEIWISPEDAVARTMLATLTHELIHAVVDCEGGHTGRFAVAARQIGLVGKLTATTAGEPLAQRLHTIAAELGPYPGSRIDLIGVNGTAGGKTPRSSGPAVQTARQLKLECTSDDQMTCYGYTVRTTRKWIDLGLPLCPSGHEMHET